MDSDEGGFVYQPMDSAVHPKGEVQENDDNEEFIYEPSSDAINDNNTNESNPDPKPVSPPSPKATPALSRVEHEKIYGAATSGDLDVLQRLIQTAVADERATVFSLVNEPSPRGGLTLLHAAASRGHLEVVKWRM
jgi:hypothetical protein